MKKINVIIILFLFTGSLFAAETWDIIDKSMAAWNVNEGAITNKAWTTLQKGSGITVTQKNGYVNFTKTSAQTSNNYAFLTPQTLTVSPNTAYSFEIKVRINATDKQTFPDSESLFEANQISVRLNKKALSVYLKHGDEESGYMSLAAAATNDEDDKYKINTSEWHVYRFVLSADNSRYDVYIDDMESPVFEDIPTYSKSENNLICLGAESPHRCNIDVEYVKMGTGDFYSKPKISSVSISSDSHIANTERTVSVTVNTVLCDDNEKLALAFVDEDDNTIVDPIELTVTNNVATGNFTIPATVSIGKYAIKAFVPNGKIGDVVVLPKTIQYVVADVSPLETKMFPQVKPVGFVRKIEDYKYIGPSKEFIFPSIVDTKPHIQDGKFLNNEKPLNRYYLFYAPHENPGGMYLSTAPTLDGPWTEQNTVIDLAWAKAVSGSNINTADHISACQVVWNEGLNKYIMYFHGPNSTTHYATSDNLKDWTFGASILSATQFASNGKETSYGKVFEHEIPGLNNKYVMVMMMRGDDVRRVHWAHSADGLNWTAVKKPLVSPDLDYKKVPGTDRKPSYVGSFGNNVSGPALFVKDGRYFIFCHGSSGNICVVEVGESFDMEIHWGEYMKAADIVIDTDAQGKPMAVPRIASPDFIQDDAGEWYLFLEAGSRLGANIAYAKESTGSGIKEIINTESVSISGSVLDAGQAISIKSIVSEVVLSDIALYNISGNEIYRQAVSGNEFSFQAPAVSGLYILNVSLDNNTSSEVFKILVK